MNDRTIDSDQPASPDDYVSVESRNGKVTMSVRCDLASLGQLRRRMDEELASILEPSRRAEFVVAINEAVTNAIESQQRNNVSVPITVTIDPSHRLVVIDDHAKARHDAGDHQPAEGGDDAAGDPAMPEGVLPPPSTFRGRGMHIMRAICPDVQIVSTDVGSSVVFPLA